MVNWKTYQRLGRIECRPYVPGEDLSAVSVSDADAPNVGKDPDAMIARNPANSLDQWYIAGEYFKRNYGAV